MRFEREVCKRCDGSGSYSFNLKDGRKCYGCNGKGDKLTKRGKAANAWFANNNTIKAGDAKVGQVVYDSFNKFKILEIKQGVNGNGYDTVSFIVDANGYSHSYGAEYDLRVKLSVDDHEELLAAAIEFQNTLTKQGIPRKKRS